MQIPVFAYIATSSYLVPVTFGFVRYRNLNKAMKFFLACCLASALGLLAQFVLGRMRINNLFVINWASLFETSLLGLSLASAAERARARTLYTAIVGTYVVFWIAVYFMDRESGGINTLFMIFSRLVVIALSVHFLYSMTTRFDVNLAAAPMFWVVSGSILYSTGTLFILGFGNELISYGSTFFLAAWHINWALMLISNIMFARGFSCTIRT
jgi:hypothetical protein